MAGPTLTVGSQLQCPHGGTVVITPANLRAKAAGQLIATTADTFTVVGCSLATSGSPPCVSVLWIVSDLAARAGAATLDQGSSGICLTAAQVPQGPVLVLSTQSAVRTR